MAPKTFSEVPAVRIENLSKSFVEGKPVLRGVDLTINRGEVHALLGANGSGKSTLVKIFAGYHTADDGSRVAVGGVNLPLPIDSVELRKVGVRFVHQGQELVPGLSVVDNMRLGARYMTQFGWKIQWKKEKTFALEQFKEFGIDVDPLADVEGLPMSTLSKIVILRALEKDDDEEIRVVVLDEPTASLGEKDATHLMEWIRQIARDQEVGFLFVSHRLPEVFSVADTVTVLRNGEVATSGPLSNYTHDSIIEAIVGRRIEAYYPARNESLAKEVLAVTNLCGGEVQDLSFTLRRGEILGLTGIGGSGFEEVPYLLVDNARHAQGRCVIDGEEIPLKSASIAERVRRGMVLVPENRLRDALAADMSVRENVSLPRLESFYRKGLLGRTRERNHTEKVMDSVGVVPAESEMLMNQFSGGNQQKVVLGKWLATEPKVLLLHEPTQGVDVGARSEIFKALAAFVDGGGAVVVSSVEYEDLANICNRVIVFGHGRAHQEISSDALSTESVTEACYRADAETSSGGVVFQ
jgi:ribose transport system ATP-binding protein